MGHDTVLQVMRKENAIVNINVNRGTPMDLVYELFDRYMEQKDKLFLFYMVVAVILMRKKVSAN